MFAWSPTPIEASLEEHVVIPFLYLFLARRPRLPAMGMHSRYLFGAEDGCVFTLCPCSKNTGILLHVVI
jgi:hypothetical protein